MKILHTTLSLDPSYGGPARSVPELADAQAALGHEVYVWAAEGRNRQNELRFSLVVFLEGEILEVLNTIGCPEIVHDNCLWHPYTHSLARFCIKEGVCRVVSTRGMLEPWAFNQKKWRKKLAWWLYQRQDLQAATALHATADQEKDHLVRLGLKQKIISQPNGINVEFVSEGREVQLQPREERTVLFLGRIHPQKGLSVLIDAWAKVRPSGWRMLVIGPGDAPYVNRMQELVKTAGLQDSWVFRGAVNDFEKWEVYSSVDLFVLPTYSESFGLVVAEALGAGIPVITTKGAPWSGLLENSCGWWVDCNSDEIADALLDATRLAPEQLAKMGMKGREWASRDFSWPRVARVMLDEYRILVRS